MTFPIQPVSDDTYLAARTAYFEHVALFSDALSGKVAAMVLAAYPTARSLVAHGEYGEEFEMRLRAQRVLDADGDVIAGFGPLRGWTEQWDDFSDEVDDVLDHLAQINGDEYLGEHTFTFQPPDLAPVVTLSPSMTATIDKAEKDEAIKRTRRLDVPDAGWEPSGEPDDPSARLNASIVVNGVSMHLEAHAIRREEGGVMVSDTPWPEDLDHLFAFATPDTPFQTMTYDGREYVLVAFPHAS